MSTTPTRDALYALRNELYAITDICNAAFAAHDRSAYARIERKLEALETCPEVEEMRGLCKAGPTLVSARFGYPHIADAARRLRERLAASATP